MPLSDAGVVVAASCDLRRRTTGPSGAAVRLLCDALSYAAAGDHKAAVESMARISGQTGDELRAEFGGAADGAHPGAARDWDLATSMWRLQAASGYVIPIIEASHGGLLPGQKTLHYASVAGAVLGARGLTPEEAREELRTMHHRALGVPVRLLAPGVSS